MVEDAVPDHARMAPNYRLVLVAAFFIGFGVYGYFCVKHGTWSEKEKHGCDFTAFYSAGELARKGQNIYDFKLSSTPRRPFNYPPFFALIPMAPLSLLSHNAAHAVFYALSILMLFAACCILARWLWPATVTFWRSAEFGLLLTLAICWRFIHSNATEGNANLLIAALLVFGLHAALKAREGAGPTRGIWSGVWIALATVYKITPGLFGVYFFWSRKGWAMLGGAVGLALFLFVLPAIWLGWETNTRYERAFGDYTVRKALGKGADPDAGDEIVIGRPKDLDPEQSENAIGLGVSLRGPVTSLLTPAIVLKKHKDEPRTVNIAALDPARVKLVVTMCSLALLLVTVALTFSARAHAGVFDEALCWSLVTVTMVLISPLTRIAHLTVLILPVAVLVAMLLQRALSGFAKHLAVAALILVGAGPAVMHAILSERARESLNAMGFTTAGLVVLYGAVAWAIWGRLRVFGAMKVGAR
ncbi:MAG TPA: glycosyltransferase family 87 protein [Planctomycetota bacterium]|nr:glycosyltransferase family 87 protein [Planctomycetota bacterium]